MTKLTELRPGSQQWEMAALEFGNTNDLQCALDAWEITLAEYNDYCKSNRMFALQVKKHHARYVLSGENILNKIAFGQMDLDAVDENNKRLYYSMPDTKELNKMLGRKSPAYSAQEGKDVRDVNPMIQAWEAYLQNEINK